jgi:hypothetical protein
LTSIFDLRQRIAVVCAIIGALYPDASQKLSKMAREALIGALWNTLGPKLILLITTVGLFLYIFHLDFTGAVDALAWFVACEISLELGSRMAQRQAIDSAKQRVEAQLDKDD